MHTLIYSIIAILLVISNYAKADDTVNKEVSMAGSPWEPFYGEKLIDHGLVSKIVVEAYKRSGYKVKFYFLTWARCLLEVEFGRIDATPIAYYTEERAKKYFYSDPFMDSPIVFFKHIDSNISWRSLRDLQPYRIGTGIGIVYSPDFDKADFLNKIAIPDDTINFQKIVLKRIDIALIDKYVGIYQINKKYPHLKDKLEYITPPLYVHKLYVMFSRKVPNIKKKIKAFNDGYQAILADGTYQSILKEYTSIQLNNHTHQEKQTK
ncbi:transporter substrate-binding domain-containing protein [Endozoicomonas sp. SM1973]|uniref:Transporter substrate-binding domain-containing protein n=1 Tax=Spartinivicinus marinus TaxID=2994442 RepID=A0A853IDT3_9GAMM|nr:transporter substrate-binding domain-containing protein [Spartinivicinus marinus]MCX4026176.1 transporter substrate-binding domain-containing protein [Spartinivicinus marinus]NYZ68708.1 transporter substrate-binding domain-containing protein [Spartinivicinus marinus]